MRVAAAIHGADVAAALSTYEAMSKRYYIHASPTLFNAGRIKGGLISCFLGTITDREDSIDGLYDKVSESAKISQGGGGIGLSLQDVRASGSRIRSSGHRAGGLLKYLKVLNETMRHVSQGSRRGGLAAYIEPWHADIHDFLDMKKNSGKDEVRARDLFYALWVPDLFMRRVRENGQWSLFCPREAPGLSSVHGAAFDDLYENYEQERRYRKQVPARELWQTILDSQMETGGPYLLYKDAVNAKNPMGHLGTVRGSNLCAEIVEYSSGEETAACNLCSIGLPAFVNEVDSRPTFSHEELHRIVKMATVNLDKVIDVTHYPVEKARVSNLKHRPIGIGVSGLADVFAKMRYPFDSKEARNLSREISETIYHAACEASAERASQLGSFPSFDGSAWSKGLFQFDLHEASSSVKVQHSSRWDWELLRAKVARGMRNSLLTAYMPTASTSQILGYNECFEPFTSHMYTRNVTSGEFQVITKPLLEELIRRGLWSDGMREKLVANDGSLSGISEIPDDLKNIFKTAFEISQRVIIDLAADRSPYIDQTQSMNLFMSEPSRSRISSMHMYGFDRGLKTGMYYLRTKSTASTLKYSIADPSPSTEPSEARACSTKGSGACTGCEA